MPQVTNQPKKATASTIKEGKAFRDRLRDRYQAHQWVRVINIDNEPLSWQWFPSTGELEEFTDNGTVRVITGRQAFTKKYEAKVPGNEQIWMINPGESEVLLGENADLFIEALYKKLVTKSFIDEKGDFIPGQPGRNFSWTDGLKQEQYIDKIFLGVEQPQFKNEPVTVRTAKAAK